MGQRTRKIYQVHLFLVLNIMKDYNNISYQISVDEGMVTWMAVNKENMEIVWSPESEEHIFINRNPPIADKPDVVVYPTPFFVKKKHGRQRLVFDCRSANQFFKKPPCSDMSASDSFQYLRAGNLCSNIEPRDLKGQVAPHWPSRYQRLLLPMWDPPRVR